MLPEPSLTLTLPSIHDGTELDCRIFYPPCLGPSSSSAPPPWRRHAAIVAHPYAPLGGCYDDPIVDLVSATLLRLGFLVATFNFRGASGSAGRTSWTAKAERDDYVSVIGFVLHYTHRLDPFRAAPCPPASRDGSPTTRRGELLRDGSGPSQPAAPSQPGAPGAPSPIPTPRPDPGLDDATTPILLQAGYSYGAMITTHLPPLPSILALFSSPPPASPAAHILKLATRLSASQSAVLRQPGRLAHTPSHVRAGASSPPPPDAEACLRRAVTRARRRPRGGDSTSTSTSTSTSSGGGGGPSDAAVPPTFRPAYLLVSPLQGAVTHLTALPLPGLAGRRRPAPEAERKLVASPTLAVYGDRDVFVSARRLREWTARLAAEEGSMFRAHEVSTAGHFWTEGRVAGVLRQVVRVFGEGLIGAV